MQAYEAVVQHGEALVKQLEGLAYTKQAALAAKIVGHIENCIWVLEGTSGDAWTKRMNLALPFVMKDAPKSGDVGCDLPKELLAAALIQTEAPGAPKSSGPVKVPTV